MKSIKEKAKEYDSVVERISPNQSIIDMSGRKYFEAGGNYVLECIEELIPNDEVLQNNVRCKSVIFRIQAIIEQLKK